MKKYISLISAAFLGGVMSITAINYVQNDNNSILNFGTEKANQPNVSQVLLNEPVASSRPSNSHIDLSTAAEETVKEVVHIKVTQEGQEMVQYDPFDYFLRGNTQGKRYKSPDRKGSGSGVVIRQDGYIVTNNHVVNGADKIEVVFHDNKSFEATVVGVDPSTDLALLKIEAKDLQTIKIGNSDELRLGEWVLAVGNPYNLNSTVTAGIVSAKARNINILQGSNEAPPLEAFIQTDAAVNPGNSGGALVNASGELIGINSAIQSPTGSYSGYSFAIPVNIMKKVVNDIMEYGVVQRAFIGVSIRNINAELAQEEDLKVSNGVFIQGLANDGAAQKAGIKAGDVVVAVNDVKVNSVAELQSQIGRFNPGDEVAVTVNRDGDVKDFQLKLRNSKGNTDVVKAEDKTLVSLGVQLKEIDDDQKTRLRIPSGIEIIEIHSGLFQKSGIQKNFIVTHIDNKPVKGVDEFIKLLKSKTGGVLITGIYPNGRVKHYGVGM